MTGDLVKRFDRDRLRFWAVVNGEWPIRFQSFRRMKRQIESFLLSFFLTQAPGIGHAVGV